MLRNNRGRARAARLIFLLLMVAAGGLVVLSIVAQSLPDWDADADHTSATTAIITFLYGLSLIRYYACIVASYIVLIMWLRRAYYNMQLFT